MLLFYDNKGFYMKKIQKIEKQERIVISNIEYLKTLNDNQRREVYKKMLKDSKC